MQSNFSFLAPEFSILANIGESAEHLLLSDPVSCLFKIRLLGEKLTELLFEKHFLDFPYDNSFHNRLLILRDENILPGTIKDILFLLKKNGNQAVHTGAANAYDARNGLENVFVVTKWFYETYAKEEKDLSKLTYSEPAYLNAGQSFKKLEEDYKTLEKRFNALLSERETRILSAAEQQVIQQRSERAASKVEMSEAQTRELIDEMLKNAGWEVDTKTINFQKNRTLPEPGKNKAIAEWPAGSLWADYALFIGTELYGFVEAKRYGKDISTDLRQSKIYSEQVSAELGASLVGKWGAYKVPFLFSTNGRPYLKQIETKSGIWFLDVRKPTNHAKALQGWYSPEGLKKEYAKDIQQANLKLQQTPLDFLESKSGLGLRKYQIDAIRAVENQIVNSPHTKKALVAMATGTGKTRTIIGLCYHLIQTNRFSRILFLVDRTLLGTQANDAFKDNKVVDLNTFADIYEVKGIKSIFPKPDTRLHFATVQGMVKRLFYNEGEGTIPPVDQYDCIIIDEAHRGYLLDKEIDEEGLSFKNQQDYVSKYRMVLDYFDAYAIAMTATPALHTTEIFGKPVYTYSYREAVIDGYLIDHDPPFIIKTKLGEEGISWKTGEKPKVFDAESNTVIELDELEDELQIDIAGFNRQVLTESFNRIVVKQLVRELDPDGDEKTLIFAATDEHADRIVQYLKEEFQNEGISVADDAIQKITGKSYNPQEQVTRYRNEKFPTIAVTVDLLTTGVDIPAICNIVFMRRVKSRILYEQMLGRATRRCDIIGKEVFRIYDAVRLYEALEDYTSMKPVVANPNETFKKLADELIHIESSERAMQQIEQIVAKLQRKKHRMRASQLEDFQLYSGGESLESFLGSLLERPVTESIQRITEKPRLWEFLDRLKSSMPKVYVSDHEDAFIAMEPGYGLASRPQDYLDSFSRFLEENKNKITALNVVVTRPAELTRQSLKELLMILAQEGYEPRKVQTALKTVRNEEIGADIISIIRTLAIGTTLESHEARIKRAVNKVRTLYAWNKVQLKWLERFEKQLIAESVLQLEDLNQAPFSDAGGVEQLNKIFDDKLPLIIKAINQQMYQA